MPRHASGEAKMLQSSIFLMASAGLTAAIGFVFWALVAHLYTPSRIGLATSLLSAISLISYLSLFGFNATLIRFPATGRARNSQISWALLAVSVTGLIFGAAYLAGLGLISPQLEFVRHNPGVALSFIGFSVFAAVNLLTDSVFIGARMPQYNTLVDGIIQSLVKLMMPVFLVALGAVGILTATGVGYGVAVVASLIFMRRRLHFRFDFKSRGTRLRATAKYSATSYVSALLNLLPLLVLPSIVLRQLGAEQSAYYFMATQIATLLSAASFAISESLFSEGAHDPANIATLLRRSAKIMTLIVVPSSLVVAGGSKLILDIFGTEYAQNADGLLILLSLGSIAVAFNSWASCALRVLVRMRALVISNVVLTLAVLGLAMAFGSRGLLWIGYAWVIGNFLSGLVAAVRIPPHAFSMRAAAAAKTAAEVVAASAEGISADLADETIRIRMPGVDFFDMPTEPMFFPWNRPEAIRFAARSHSTGSNSSTGSGTRSRPRALGELNQHPVDAAMPAPTRNLQLHRADMQMRPRVVPEGPGFGPPPPPRQASVPPRAARSGQPPMPRSQAPQPPMSQPPAPMRPSAPELTSGEQVRSS